MAFADTVPGFLFGSLDYAINASAIASVHVHNEYVTFHLISGKDIVIRFADVDTAVAKYAEYTTKLEVNSVSTGTPTITSVVPAASPETVDETLTIYGTNFSATATITLKFYGDGGTYEGTATFVNSTTLTIAMSSVELTGVSLDEIEPTTVEGFAIQYVDSDGGTSNKLFSDENKAFYIYAAEITAGTGAQMQPYYGVSTEPGALVPDDITLPAYYIGDGRTYYIWDTVGQASWIGLITV